MIDTIVIVLTKDLYTINDPDKFEPSARWATSSNYRSNRTISFQNPTQKELKRGIYKPRLTLSNRLYNSRHPEPLLKVELSLPKLMFGNNFAELRYKDFNAVIEKMIAVLETMGVSITADALSNAQISTIHYSKNIQLTDGSTPFHYIQKIKEANVKMALDTNQTNYRNEGHAYKWHCNSYEVVFYDKILDLERAKLSNKRALEKDSALQMKLLKRFQKRHKLEILRMEVRLNNRKKIKSLFKSLNVKADLTFKKLFKPAISKKVLLHYLDEIESRRPLILDYKPANAKALLASLVFHNPDLSMRKILMIFGLKQALELMTIRELRALLETHGRSGWHLIMKEMKNVKLPSVQNPFQEIKKKIK